MADHRSYKPLDVRPGGPLEPLLKLTRELDANCPWLHGRRVRVDFDGSSATADVEHGLGRRYEGGWLMSRDGIGAATVALITGAVAEESGVDTSRFARVAQSSILAETVYIWVY